MVIYSASFRASCAIDILSGILSSSDDEGDSYSSDGEEGSLVIDANAQSGEVNQNGHSVDPLGYNNSPDAERQWTSQLLYVP